MEKDELKPCPFCGVKPKIDGEFVIIDHKWTCHLRSESFVKAPEKYVISNEFNEDKADCTMNNGNCYEIGFNECHDAMTAVIAQRDLEIEGLKNRIKELEDIV